MRFAGDRTFLFLSPIRYKRVLPPRTCGTDDWFPPLMKLRQDLPHCGDTHAQPQPAVTLPVRLPARSEGATDLRSHPGIPGIALFALDDRRSHARVWLRGLAASVAGMAAVGLGSAGPPTTVVIGNVPERPVGCSDASAGRRRVQLRRAELQRRRGDHDRHRRCLQRPDHRGGPGALRQHHVAAGHDESGRAGGFADTVENENGTVINPAVSGQGRAFPVSIQRGDGSSRKRWMSNTRTRWRPLPTSCSSRPIATSRPTDLLQRRRRQRSVQLLQDAAAPVVAVSMSWGGEPRQRHALDQYFSTTGDHLLRRLGRQRTRGRVARLVAQCRGSRRHKPDVTTSTNARGSRPRRPGPTAAAASRRHAQPAAISRPTRRRRGTRR